MAAIPKPISTRGVRSAKSSTDVNTTFLKYLPAVQTHAAIQFRGLSHADREEAVAESVAAAFVGVRTAVHSGKAHRLRPSTVAHYSVLNVKSGRHVGGPW